MRIITVFFLGSLPFSYTGFAQKAVATPTPTPQPTATPLISQSIAPSLQPVSKGMMYHRVYVISPLMGSGKPGDAKRPIFVPAPPAPPTSPTGKTPAITASGPAHSGLLGYQMQLSSDGNTALAEMVFSDPISFQAVMQQEATARSVTPAPTPPGNPAALSAALTTALQSAVPGLQIFERGKATDTQILTAFQAYNANFTFAGTTVRPQ
jgi:hypothetical protein